MGAAGDRQEQDRGRILQQDFRQSRVGANFLGQEIRGEADPPRQAQEPVPVQEVRVG